MKVTLKQDWCGHVAGNQVGVSDARGARLKAVGIAELEPGDKKAPSKDVPANKMVSGAQKNVRRK